MDTIHMPVTPEEAAAIGFCLACYIDNEGDKRDGIGTELLDRLQEPMVFCANGEGETLSLDLVLLAHIDSALDIYSEDPGVDQGVVARLRTRIASAVPRLIP